MPKTEKRIMFSATKEDLRELNALAEHFGENQSAVIRRALILLHHITYADQDNQPQQP